MTYSITSEPMLSKILAANYLKRMVENTEHFSGRVVSVKHGELTMAVTGCGRLGTYNAERIVKAITLLEAFDALLQREHNDFEPDNQSDRYKLLRKFYDEAVGMAIVVPEAEMAREAEDAKRYRKLRGWMSSNVPEGWNEVERIAALGCYTSWGDFDQALDGLSECNVGLMQRARQETPE